MLLKIASQNVAKSPKKQRFSLDFAGETRSFQRGSTERLGKRALAFTISFLIVFGWEEYSVSLAANGAKS
ncbi:MAG: hypothetical protein ABSG10_00335 [Terracidiphilus sp.]|jgi:hypothetical protein